MRILLTGATGLVGTALVNLWQPHHQITVLSRFADKVSQKFGTTVKAVTTLQQVDFNQIDVVVNLAGESIADKRWTNRSKNTYLPKQMAADRAAGQLYSTSDNPTPHFVKCIRCRLLWQAVWRNYR